MREVFADTGYWIALIYRDDELHERAQTVNDELGVCRIVTTEMIFVELLNYASKLGHYRRRLAADLVRALWNNTDVVIVEQTGAQLTTALERFVSRLDQH